MADMYVQNDDLDEVEDPAFAPKLGKSLRQWGHRLGFWMWPVGLLLLATPLIGGLFGTVAVGTAGFLGFSALSATGIGLLSLPAVLVGAGAVVDAMDSAGHGQGKKAVKQLFAGAVDAAVTGATTSNIGLWFLNGASGLVTGHFLGENARKIAGMGANAADKAVFRGSQVNYVVPAGVAMSSQYQQTMMQPVAMPAAGKPAQYWTKREAQARGRDPQQMYSEYMRGEGRQHVQELMSTREQQAQNPGVGRA